jgi:hypothetical protein
LVKDGRVRLTLFGKLVDLVENISITNQFQAEASLQDGGGMVICSRKPGGFSTSNFVAVVGVQINAWPIARKSTQQLPQLHIKARFIEVPEKMMGTLEKISGFTNGFTEVLAPADARALLKMVESIHGSETFAEPEVVTTSGRQTQMRATVIQTIITNFAFQETATNSAIVAQEGTMETGPILDTIATVSDGYTIDLRTIASLTEFLGYDTPTNTIPVYNSTGEKIGLPKVLPRLRVRQASAHFKLWDGQTVVLGKFENHSMFGALPPGGSVVGPKPDVQDKDVLVFITVTLVDPAGNRIHSGDEKIPFAKYRILPTTVESASYDPVKNTTIMTKNGFT